MKIGFSNLRNNLYIVLKPKFRKSIFRTFQNKFDTVNSCTKEIDCLTSSFYCYKNGEKSIPIYILKQIFQRCNVNNSKINKNISKIKTFSGIEIKIKLPIKSNSEFANLIGHLLADGHVDKSYRISYANKSEILINRFEQIVKNNFYYDIKAQKRLHLKSDTYEIRYPAIIGSLLQSFGIIQGNKTVIEFDIPKWIKNGNKDTKTSFLRAIFDDESWIRNKSITISFAKRREEQKSLIRFLLSIRKLLEEFDIKTNRILKHGSYKGKVVLGFSITGYSNLYNFHKFIGFDSERKRLQVLNEIKSYKRKVFRKGEGIELITKLLNGGKEIDIYTLSKKLGKHPETIKYHLKNLNHKRELKRGSPSLVK